MTLIKTIELDTVVIMNTRIASDKLLATLSCRPKSYTDLIHLGNAIQRLKNMCDTLEEDIQNGKEALDAI